MSYHIPFNLAQGTLYMGAQAQPVGAKVVLFGCPFDGTTSFRPGARFGPAAIRAVSDGIETYDPIMRRDLEDLQFADVGDLLLPPGDAARGLELIHNFATTIYQHGQIPAGLGGEHLLTLPLARAAAEAHPELVIVQFDAHMDMRNDYLGVQLSHATVMRRMSEIIGPERILHVGQRSGTREEFQLAESTGTLRSVSTTPQEIKEWVGDRPLYVTVDLDVLDPSLFPGTGTPEPGGVSFTTLEAWLHGLAGCRWVGWDVMELAPQLDATHVSSVVAAKVVRTMLLTSTFNGTAS